MKPEDYLNGPSETSVKDKDEKQRRDGLFADMSPFLREVLSWIEVIVLAVGLALVIVNFIIANSIVPTGSMETTIMAGDRVIGSRLHYTFGEPERGDIAIFRFGWRCEHCGRAMGEGQAPETCPYCEKAIKRPRTLYYVKRIIGMPGDLVEIKAEGSVDPSEVSLDLAEDPEGRRLVSAKVYVNGEAVREDYLREPMLYTGDMSFQVPEGQYFFLGDNRNNSLDSRYWNCSYIPRDRIIAKVLFRYFPHPSMIR